eukprot:4351186-Pyramimonas_sp.AAC.1
MHNEPAASADFPSKQCSWVSVGSRLGRRWVGDGSRVGHQWIAGRTATRTLLHQRTQGRCETDRLAQ